MAAVAIRGTTYPIVLPKLKDPRLHLAATISEVLAFYLAERGDGIVWFYHRDFASPDDRATTLWQTGK